MALRNQSTYQRKHINKYLQVLLHGSCEQYGRTPPTTVPFLNPAWWAGQPGSQPPSKLSWAEPEPEPDEERCGEDWAAGAEVVLGSRIGDLPPDSKIRPIFMLWEEHHQKAFGKAYPPSLSAITAWHCTFSCQHACPPPDPLRQVAVFCFVFLQANDSLVSSSHISFCSELLVYIYKDLFSFLPINLDPLFSLQKMLGRCANVDAPWPYMCKLGHTKKKDRDKFWSLSPRINWAGRLHVWSQAAASKVSSKS